MRQSLYIFVIALAYMYDMGKNKKKNRKKNQNQAMNHFNQRMFYKNFNNWMNADLITKIKFFDFSFHAERRNINVYRRELLKHRIITDQISELNDTERLELIRKIPRNLYYKFSVAFGSFI